MKRIKAQLCSIFETDKSSTEDVSLQQVRIIGALYSCDVEEIDVAPWK